MSDPREEGYLPIEELRFKLREIGFLTYDDIGEEYDQEILESEEPPEI